MTTTTITALPNATTPLSGTERVPMDQSGATKDATTQDIANLAPGTDLSYTASTRLLASSTGVDATLPLAGAEAGLMAAADKTKLDGIASGATANSSDATLLDRANHTGTQAAGTITGLATVATSGAYSDLSGLPTLGTAAAANTGTSAGNVVQLDNSGKLPAVDGSLLTNLPSGGGGSTDLGYTASTRLLTSSTGADVTLPLATTSDAGLQPASGYGTISYAAQVTLDFAALAGQMNSISLTGDLELLSSNLANAQEVRLRLVCDATQRTLTFPTDWKFVGTKPANLAASKVAILSLAAFGTTNADVVAAYAVQS